MREKNKISRKNKYKEKLKLYMVLNHVKLYFMMIFYFYISEKLKLYIVLGSTQNKHELKIFGSSKP